MTKKDYELIAEAISRRIIMGRPITGNNMIVYQVALSIATALESENHKFNRQKFLIACGVEHQHGGENCEISDCVICGLAVRRCELDENLQCSECK